MRLLTHNMLVCNIKACVATARQGENALPLNYPLKIQVDNESGIDITDTNYSKDFVLHILKSIDWTGLVQTVAQKDECVKYYKFGKTLGTGSFATVKSAVNKADNTKWAVKCIEKASLAPDDEEALRVEVEVLQMVEHPNIVKLKEVFDCPKTFYMVMEEMSGGELFDRIVEKEKYSEREARTVVHKLATALAYCHTLGIVHRDLKVRHCKLNLKACLENAEIKIADFGLAKLIQGNSMMQTACGTPGYVAPEILEGKPYGGEVDMWSLGVITYILLCGFPPFYDENNAALFATIKAGAYDFPSPYWDHVSDSGTSIMCQHKLDVTRSRSQGLDQSHACGGRQEAVFRRRRAQPPVGQGSSTTLSLSSLVR
ncbi:hypothetical protein DYB37_007566 [Aphanomyces astaci]|uniref:Protein kinase domain-containing protein n=1 Tax=Aphanomyces astaci TaxID=112090 RepID=A0A3L6VVW7_APHAT|nr:hypothetical protein DYB35_008675 [Aphanomyces astaci]RHZ18375.1 hypothetical protein DYB37_007566 [Aphanomyces astaci]RLO12967.1 hypothetical protein DYB28_002500 [Aphanomyces astaci]